MSNTQFKRLRFAAANGFAAFYTRNQTLSQVDCDNCSHLQMHKSETVENTSLKGSKHLMFIICAAAAFYSLRQRHYSKHQNNIAIIGLIYLNSLQASRFIPIPWNQADTS